MRKMSLMTWSLALVLFIVSPVRLQAADHDPLPSWNDGPTRQAIVDFVERVSDPAHVDFVPEAERIATFDNDGNLWSEQPYYFQLQFALDEIRRQAPQRPEWADDPLVKAVLANDLEAIAAGGMESLMKVIMLSHAGMSRDEFRQRVAAWLNSARHPRFDRPYTDLVYQPMLELLDYLRDHGFETWIVSGGGIEMIRVFSESVYGIPPQQVVGSQIELEYAMVDGQPVIRRLPEVRFIDDKEGKPVGIAHHIGRRPILASGNSDGDLAMLQWTTAGEGARLALLLHHTDAEREWAYDRDSHIGGLNQALDVAQKQDWVITDMARDWRVIYPHDLAGAVTD